MPDDKNRPTESKESSNATEQSQESVLPVHNPLDPSDDRDITQEDIENEQKYKEALTERD
jgi:hypothetical protein